MTRSITLRRPDDWHLHLRDGEVLKAVLRHTTKQFARAIVMPNLKPPITRVALARDYRERILAALDPGEAVFIETILRPLLKDFPALKVVLEHITTESAADFVLADTSGRLGATITPQHLMFNRNAMFTGGLRPHFYCLPVLKRERHRLALRKAATSGDPRFFLGTDSAPHFRALKEAGCGCAGIFNAPAAMHSYCTVFDEEKALGSLEAFSSLNGPRFYGLPPNEDWVTWTRTDYLVPEDIPVPGGATIHPFLGGTKLAWSAS
ncbi:amidohydrolase family protein [Variovorax paradoxus]|uniref:dihydroorotase n=1 Tax=Variovorax paradoxus TaxID=34073 RepID=A0A0H2M958_VARPD|nr:amidohydrolase family protein [Variovorax paradoxus]KLN57227.1 dihydroorotase [Variovorax paradoxus]